MSSGGDDEGGGGGGGGAGSGSSRVPDPYKDRRVWCGRRKLTMVHNAPPGRAVTVDLRIPKDMLERFKDWPTLRTTYWPLGLPCGLLGSRTTGYRTGQSDDKAGRRRSGLRYLTSDQCRKSKAF